MLVQHEWPIKYIFSSMLTNASIVCKDKRGIETELYIITVAALKGASK